jgi:hypothetical protein
MQIDPSPAGKREFLAPLRLELRDDGRVELILSTGGTDADAVIEESGHTPNGYFWDGVAGFLLESTAPEIGTSIEYDSEAGTFVAIGTDRRALARLGALLAVVANNPDAMRELIRAAQAAKFEFDD